ncbi:MAG: hypothetical protein R3B90_02640 [Planctomycetaceae bacterium]
MTQVWQKTLKLRESEAPQTDWVTLQKEAQPVLDKAMAELSPIVNSQGIKVPLAQRILWLVDVKEGVTHAEGHLRKILAAGPEAKPEDYDAGAKYMSEAASLIPQ